MEEIKNKLQLERTQWRAEVEVAECSYMKAGGRVAWLAQVRSKADLLKILNFLEEHNKKAPAGGAIPYLVAGALSNTLLAVDYFPGVLIQYLADQVMVTEEGQVQAEAGVTMAALAATVGEKGWAGWAGFTSLPGTLGGAIYNNAHFGADLLADWLVEVEFFDLETRKVRTLPRTDLDFDYDQSIFQRQPWIILAATFKLHERAEPEELRKQAREALAWRQKTQPLDQPSLGCFFKNPPSTARLRALFPEQAGKKRRSAGLLIDRCGLKGKKVGGAQVSEKHGAFLINNGGATPADILTLAEEVRRQVQEQCGVLLEPEVTIMTKSGANTSEQQKVQHGKTDH